MIKGPVKSAVIVLFFALVVGLLPVVALPLPYEGLDWLSYGSAMYVNVPPYNITIDPSSGSSGTGETLYFTTWWGDLNGVDDLKQCYFHIGRRKSLVNNVTLFYQAQRNELSLRTDDGSGWSAPCAPGSFTILENSQARVYCVATTVSVIPNTLFVSWLIEFKSGYTGDKKLGLKVKDVSGAKASGQWLGEWTIE